MGRPKQKPPTEEGVKKMRDEYFDSKSFDYDFFINKLVQLTERVEALENELYKE